MAYKKIPANLYAYGVIIRYRNFILIKPNGDVKQTIINKPGILAHCCSN
jgi:hypothetical protein